MLKPEAFQAIEEYIRMIEELDEESLQEAIRETNDRLEKVERVQSASLRMPVSRKPIAQKQKAEISDLFCPHCGSHDTSRNGSVRGVPRLFCRDCKKSFGSNHGNVTYGSNFSEEWDRYLEGMVCSDTLQQLSEKCDISLATAHN
jgi:transposase-like protein